MNSTEQGEKLMYEIYEKLASTIKVDDIRITRNLELDPMIEIEEDGKKYVLTMIEKGEED